MRSVSENEHPVQANKIPSLAFPWGPGGVSTGHDIPRGPGRARGRGAWGRRLTLGAALPGDAPPGRVTACNAGLHTKARCSTARPGNNTRFIPGLAARPQPATTPTRPPTRPPSRQILQRTQYHRNKQSHTTFSLTHIA